MDLAFDPLRRCLVDPSTRCPREEWDPVQMSDTNQTPPHPTPRNDEVTWGVLGTTLPTVYVPLRLRAHV